MAIVKCEFCKKFYDNVTYDTCPHCTGESAFFSDIGDDQQLRESKTVGMFDYDQGDYSYDTDSKTEAYFENVSSDDKTIGVFFEENDCDPVTGWIVCVEGTVRGKSYEIHMNRNFVGRDKLMDVCIPDDLQICRENHFSIIYDCKSHKFFVQQGKGTVLLNSELLQGSRSLKEGDLFEIGESKYIFIPYCNSERNWEI